MVMNRLWVKETTSKRVELEKQLKVVDQDILTFRGAILACNELIEENEPKSEDTTGIVKEEDGG